MENITMQTIKQSGGGGNHTVNNQTVGKKSHCKQSNSGEKKRITVNNQPVGEEKKESHRGLGRDSEGAAARRGGEGACRRAEET